MVSSTQSPNKVYVISLDFLKPHIFYKQVKLGASLEAQSIKNLPSMKETRV